MYGSLRFKRKVSDHKFTALAVTCIGFGIKIPTKLGLLPILGVYKTQVSTNYIIFCVLAVTRKHRGIH